MVGYRLLYGIPKSSQPDYYIQFGMHESLFINLLVCNHSRIYLQALFCLVLQLETGWKLQMPPGIEGEK
jgi:hypothetical protein